MVIVGAGGLATQLIDDFVKFEMKDLVYWTEVETKYGFLENYYPFIKTDEEVREHFKNVSNKFMLAISGPASKVRQSIRDRFISMGGTLHTYVSPLAPVSTIASVIGEGTIILSHTVIEAGVTFGKECIVNKTTSIGHGCVFGDYCEIGAGVLIAGEAEIGEGSFVATGVVIHPRIKIGKNVTIAAGAVVTKNIPDHSLIAGVPAVIKFTKKNVG